MRQRRGRRKSGNTTRGERGHGVCVRAGPEGALSECAGIGPGGVGGTGESEGRGVRSEVQLFSEITSGIPEVATKAVEVIPSLTMFKSSMGRITRPLVQHRSSSVHVLSEILPVPTAHMLRQAMVGSSPDFGRTKIT
eukprot:scaffold43467_cov65-Phaeocystis_antarctica.AAC.5